MVIFVFSLVVSAGNKLLGTQITTDVFMGSVMLVTPDLTSNQNN